MKALLCLTAWATLSAAAPLAEAIAAEDRPAALALEMAEVRAHYREAIYSSAPLHRDVAVMQEALDALQRTWTDLRENPDLASTDAGPDRPDEDRVKAITDIAEAVAALARQGQTDQAYQALREMGPLLCALDRDPGKNLFRNGLTAFDEKLAETADDDFLHEELDPELFVQLCEQIGVLDYLDEQLAKRAPPRYADDPAFLDAEENMARQIRGLRMTVLSGQRDPVRAALTDLRLSFDHFWLFYG